MEIIPDQIKHKLLRALDAEYHIVDIAAVSEILPELEKIVVTEEILGRTDFGRIIYEIRKKNVDVNIAKKLKQITTRWREQITQALRLAYEQERESCKATISHRLPKRKREDSGEETFPLASSFEFPDRKVFKKPKVDVAAEGCMKKPNVDVAAKRCIKKREDSGKENFPLVSGVEIPERKFLKKLDEGLFEILAVGFEQSNDNGSSSWLTTMETTDLNNLRAQAELTKKYLQSSAVANNLDIPNVNFEVPMKDPINEEIEVAPKKCVSDGFIEILAVGCGQGTGNGSSSWLTATETVDGDNLRAQAELTKKYLQSSAVASKVRIPRIQSKVPKKDPVDEEIEKILSQLPPINLQEISLDDDTFVPPEHGPVTEEQMERLRNGQWEGVNGMHDSFGNWRTWQENCDMVSHSGKTLRVMPYVNIDRWNVQAFL